eukprot:GEZU01016245.1.p1 GENE.GEZU01016245.1~~GEZU01016245.1.p1  ORF type:complete len:763 (+),score=208.62 GEZU01016245.1:3-2291(+)
MIRRRIFAASTAPIRNILFKFSSTHVVQQYSSSAIITRNPIINTSAVGIKQQPFSNNSLRSISASSIVGESNKIARSVSRSYTTPRKNAFFQIPTTKFTQLHSTSRAYSSKTETIPQTDGASFATPLQKYQDLVQNGTLLEDHYQRETIEKLENIFQQTHQVKSLQELKGKNVQGLYIYGEVGCGKSMLMDLFFSSITSSSSLRARRVHFHQFMLDVHKRMHEYRQERKRLMIAEEEERAKQQRDEYGKKGIFAFRASSKPLAAYDAADAIPPVVQQIAAESWLICFDEFQVTDVADALIINRIFSALLDQGVVMIATTNRPPEDLYKGGIQRKYFLPFIDFLREKCHIHHLSSPKDYRKETLYRQLAEVHNSNDDTVNNEIGYEQQHSYVVGPTNNKETNDKMHAIFHRLVAISSAAMGTTPTEPRVEYIDVAPTRSLKIPRTANGVAMFDFKDLCGDYAAVGAADYIAICENYHTVILYNVPRLSVYAQRNSARRLITLIDELYEHKTKLVLGAEVPLSELFALPKEGESPQLTIEQLAIAQELGLIDPSKTGETVTLDQLNAPITHVDASTTKQGGNVGRVSTVVTIPTAISTTTAADGSSSSSSNADQKDVLINYEKSTRFASILQDIYKFQQIPYLASAREGLPVNKVMNVTISHIDNKEGGQAQAQVQVQPEGDELARLIENNGNGVEAENAEVVIEELIPYLQSALTRDIFVGLWDEDKLYETSLSYETRTRRASSFRRSSSQLGLPVQGDLFRG